MPIIFMSGPLVDGLTGFTMKLLLVFILTYGRFLWGTIFLRLQTDIFLLSS